ncbi:Glycerophosphoryl diester phosphodiesterase [Globisporangium polare]
MGQKATCGDAGIVTPTPVTPSPATPVAPKPSPAPVPAPAPAPSSKKSPLIIGHRGAPGYLPEHTIEGYTLAIEMGVDFIEPDLVITKDGVLIARHEPNIIATTNVADKPEFASRKKTVKIDGNDDTGFFVHDFTLAEIKTLGAKQAFAERDHQYDGLYKIPTFDEIIALAKSKSIEVGRTIGIYPETKHPTYHRTLGLPIEEKMLATLEAAGWNHKDAPVYVQSFEMNNLKEIRKVSTIKIVQLVDNPVPPYDWVVSGRNGTSYDVISKKGLDEVMTYADVISPWKRDLIEARPIKVDASGAAVDVDGDGQVDDSDYYTYINNTVIADAHARGLKVHSYTFRDEAHRLAANYSKDPIAEYLDFFDHGLDGLFSDNGKTAVAARKKWLAN